MSGAPTLYPSGFIEFNDSCSGPKLYRNQPSRESSAPKLNDFMAKYSTAEISNFDFMNTLTYIKYLNKNWNKIPNEVRQEILNLLTQSQGGGLAEALKPQTTGKVEHFANTEDESKAMEDLERLIEEQKVKSNKGYQNLKVVSSKGYTNIFTLVIVAIVAIVLGFLIACVST